MEITAKPSTLAEAIAIIREEFPEDGLLAWAAKPKFDAVIEAHFGLGMWIRSEWIYGEGCSLVLKLREKAYPFYHEDEISSIILEGLWRFLNGEKAITIEQLTDDRYSTELTDHECLGHTQQCDSCETGGHDMSNLDKAITLATHAHADQTDKADQPYILHPLRVMLQVSEDHERVVAALHDVVEDIDISVEITSDGVLRFSGQDMGEATERFFGKDEYEYWLVVEAIDKERILLALIDKLYAGNLKVISEFQGFLGSEGIPSKFWSYV